DRLERRFRQQLVELAEIVRGGETEEGEIAEEHAVARCVTAARARAVQEIRRRSQGLRPRGQDAADGGSAGPSVWGSPASQAWASARVAPSRWPRPAKSNRFGSASCEGRMSP